MKDKTVSTTCNVTFTTIQASTKDWYFDSGCSRHIIDNRSYFFQLKEWSLGHLTFGDRAKGRILAKGNIIKSYLSCMKDGRFFEGLTANLISINPLCYQGYIVNFCKEECILTNKNNVVFMKGIG